MKTSIVTLTMNPAIDLFLEVDHVAPFQRLRARKPRTMAGGGGINVSRAIRRLGGESIAVFPAGGASGELLKTLLHRESIAIDPIECEEPVRENVIVLDAATRDEFQFIVPGPKIGIDEWKHCLRAIGSITPAPEYVVASGSLPPGVPVDFYRRLAGLARERGFRLIVDSSGEPLRHLGPGTFLLKMNAMDNDAARRAEHVVVPTGSGATLIDQSGVRHFDAPAVNVASRIDAGDTMVAGIVIALSRGWAIDDAVQYGLAPDRELVHA